MAVFYSENVLQIRDIYNRLQDEMSVKIFENRLLYSLTGDMKYIDSIAPPLRDESISYYSQFHNIVVYGAGHMGMYFALLCGDSVKISAFCDKDKTKHRTARHGYPVISLEELKENYISSTIAISITDDKAVSEIKNELQSMGFNENQILSLKDRLDDTFPQKQYFDKDILNLKDGEIFVDGGCFDFGTCSDFVKHCGGSYRKIIAFEPSPNQYSACVNNSKNYRDISIYPYALWNKNTELNFDNHDGSNASVSCDSSDSISVKAVMLDDILNSEKATFIKLDVEGAELNALMGAEQTIRNYHPKLAICVYHKPEDIWEIPAYILSLHDDYKFYLRHYSFNMDETVLYAV